MRSNVKVFVILDPSHEAGWPAGTHHGSWIMLQLYMLEPS